MKSGINSLMGGVALIGLGVLVAILLAVTGWLGFGAAADDPAADMPAKDRAAIEAVVREYILANPEIIPEAMQELQRRDSAQALGGIRDQVERPFPGAVLGNPNGSVTLVEFTDFACGFCREAVDQLDEVIADNSDLRVVVRELPILSPQSEKASRMALAAAEQGKFGAFHRALFAAGQPSDAAIEAAARSAGLDMARARSFAMGETASREIESNLALARQLGFNGTPSWVVGDRIFAGAIGADAIAEAVEDARS